MSWNNLKMKSRNFEQLSLAAGVSEIRSIVFVNVPEKRNPPK